MEQYQEQFRIRYTDGDRFGKLKLRALFDYAQEIASVHATRLGCGDQFRAERNLAWVLSRMKVRMMDHPVSESTVTVTTWPSGYDRLFATREFRFTTGNPEHVFAEATSYWLLVDIAAGKLVMTQKAMEGIPLDIENAERIFTDLDKLKIPADAPRLASFDVREHEIDLNHHVNNAEYAAMVTDVLGAGRYPREMQINYQREIPPQSTVDIRGTISDGGFLLGGYLGGSEAFQVSGLF